MYKIGDLILYGGTGVCRVMDITTQSTGGSGEGQLFYVFKPLYQSCTIFAPVENGKVFVRPIISKEEALRIIDLIPDMSAEAYHNRALSQLAVHYNGFLNTHDCEDLIQLTMSIYAKRQAVEQQKRKFGAVDERYLKRAEDLLFGELSAALEIPKEEVPDFIADRISGKQREVKE